MLSQPGFVRMRLQPCISRASTTVSALNPRSGQDVVRSLQLQQINGCGCGCGCGAAVAVDSMSIHVCMYEYCRLPSQHAVNDGTYKLRFACLVAAIRWRPRRPSRKPRRKAQGRYIIYIMHGVLCFWFFHGPRTTSSVVTFGIRSSVAAAPREDAVTTSLSQPQRTSMYVSALRTCVRMRVHVLNSACLSELHTAVHTCPSNHVQLLRIIMCV